MTRLIEKKYFPWACWLVVALVYMFQYGLLVIPESVIPILKHAYHIGMSDIGIYSAMFLYAWVVMQIPAGIMFDHYDSRKLMFASTLLLAGACMLQVFTTDFSLALLSRLLMGAAGSFSFIGAVYLARGWFSVALLPIIIGVTESLSGVSEVGFPIVFAKLPSEDYWRGLIFLVGLIVLVLAILSLVFVRDVPSETVVKKHRSKLIDFRAVFANKYLWGLGIYVGFAMAYYVTMSDMWGVFWMKRQFGLTTTDAVYMNGLSIVGFMIGAPVIGWLSQFIEKRILIMVCMLFEYVCLGVVDYSAHSVLSHAFMMLPLGFFTGAIVLAFDMAKELVLEKHYGLAVGFLNTFFGLVGVIITPLMGYVLMLHAGIVVYKPMLIMLTGAVGAIMSIFIAWRFRFDD